MHIHDLILLVIGSEKSGKLRGRTLLQKKLYFLSVLMGEELDFRAHYYGPYSSLVSENLDILVGNGFLNEITETFATDQNIFGEIRRHTYSLTDDGQALLEELKRTGDFENWQKSLDSINRQDLANDFNKLSIAAKVHYIVSEKGTVTLEQVRQIANEYGWQLKDTDIENVLSFLKELSLVVTEE